MNTPSAHPYHLQRDSGVRLRLGPAGASIGRLGSCNIVLTDPRAGRIHALIWPDELGLKVIVAGGNPVVVDEQIIRTWAPLAPGSVVGFPGEQITVLGPPAPEAVARWLIEHTDQVVRPGGLDFTVGGDAEADLVIPGLPERAARFAVAQGSLLATFAVEAEVGGQAVRRGEMVSVPVGAPIRIGDRTLRAFREVEGRESATTMAWAHEPPAHRIALRQLRSGAQLDLQFADLAVRVTLPELSARLLAGLCNPGLGARAGALVSDADLSRRVWPDRPPRASEHIERLLARLREHLLGHGINPLRLIERRGSQSATRLLVSPLTEVAFVHL